jgi:hypothetical protein
MISKAMIRVTTDSEIRAEKIKLLFFFTLNMALSDVSYEANT